MSILKVSQMGHPVLRQVAAPVQEAHFETEAFQRLVADMHETMVAYSGAGLAAPQVHKSNRILVYQSETEDGEPEIQTLVNPIIEPLDDTMEKGWEGCLSIPGIRGSVPRYTRIRVVGLDDQGTEIEYEAEDFEARVIQHEVDHLDGILYFDRMEDLKTLAFLEEHAMFWGSDDEDEG